MIKKGLFWLATSFLYLISLLPFPLLYILSDFLYLVLYYIISYRRKVTSDNLFNAFPEKSFDERKQIEKKYYRFLADMIIESIKMLSISEESLKKRFKYFNVSEIFRHFENGKSVIGVTGHYGNWEWASQAISLELDEPVLVVYKPLVNKNFEKLINNMRSRFGSVMVAMNNTFRKVIEFRQKRHLIVLVGDQTPSGEELQYFTTFLNQPTAVFLGIEKIAKLNDYAIVYCTFKRVQRGYYEGHNETLVENAKNTAEYEITEMHTRKLEKVIREKPEFWLWSHRRWKFKPENIDK
jgi:KDO2-lipid IV(A) lauroyltransferase